MHRNIKGLLSTAAALSISVGAWAGDDRHGDRHKGMEDQRDRSAQMGQQAQPGDARDGFVMIEERLIFVLADAPQLHMTSALGKMKQDDRKGAAGELRVAADYIEMQKARAREGTSEILADRADKLRKMADKVEAGELRDAEKISRTFAKTSVTLARHHNELAKKHLDNERYVAAGYDVAAAAKSFQQANVWYGQEPSDEVLALIDNARHVSENLRMEAVGEKLDRDAQPAAARDAVAGRDRDGDARPAAGRPLGDPRIQTTPAQAENIVEHAQDITGKLGEKISQFSQRIDPDRDSGENDEEKDQD
jgi:hypothetical protein